MGSTHGRGRPDTLGVNSGGTSWAGEGCWCRFKKRRVGRRRRACGFESRPFSQNAARSVLAATCGLAFVPLQSIRSRYGPLPLSRLLVLEVRPALGILSHPPSSREGSALLPSQRQRATSHRAGRIHLRQKGTEEPTPEPRTLASGTRRAKRERGLELHGHR